MMNLARLKLPKTVQPATEGSRRTSYLEAVSLARKY